MRRSNLATFLFRIRHKICRILKIKTIKSMYGPCFIANHSDATFNFYIKGAYGFYYWDRLKTLSFPFIYLDIGSNQGLYTIGAALNRNSVKCFSFEPVLSTYELLVANIHLNHVSEKCVAINKGISDKQGFADITLKFGHSGAATLAATNQLTQQDASVIKIALCDFNELTSIVGPGSLPIVVKIDVEGHEPVVLTQLLKSHFATRIVEIFMEIDEEWVSIDVIRAQLNSAGLNHLTKIGDGKHYDLLAERNSTSPSSHSSAPEQ